MFHIFLNDFRHYLFLYMYMTVTIVTKGVLFFHTFLDTNLSHFLIRQNKLVYGNENLHKYF
jgi:hypothetical protein